MTKMRVFLNKPMSISYESEKSTLDMFDWILEYAMGNEYNNQDEKTLEYADRIRKELEAFRIIKEKDVDVDYLRKMALKKQDFDDGGLAPYNDSFRDYKKWLTQEEFNLLKEVLA